ncbi:hypothetical protein MKZ38_010237 [Zalerion maritima]|uniref:MPN domain-containing protein n=1 Tax=Zalerion maritima TaxID=339359 RepID=A0AAD5WV83_9PEZI|nr:hypothetical protein MKZ38_010237 [Zalerion maritima]
MARGPEGFIHMSRPLAPTPMMHSNIAPLNVKIQPQAVMSILDAKSRHLGPSRAIGALIGVRSEDGGEVTVTQTFAIPHTETEDQVEVDVDYQKQVLAMTLKASPREHLLGWYTTSAELNSFSALIQNFFASPETGTHPHPAVHLTLETTPGQTPKPTCYISSHVAVSAERAAETCFFIEVPCRVSTNETDRAGLDMISSGINDESRTAPVVSDVQSLRRTLESQIDMLTRVGEYVGGVLDEEEEPNHALGQYLMNALSLAPKVDPADIERDFNNHIQDVLMVSYLANTIRTQIDLSQKLAVAVLGNDKDAEGKTEGSNEKGPQRGGGGKRGRGGRGGGGGNREPREPREPQD